MISVVTLAEIFYDHVCKCPWMDIYGAKRYGKPISLGMDAAFAPAYIFK